MTTSTLRRRSVPAAAVLALALALSACGGSNEEEAGGGDSALSGDVLSDGSSTVAPLTSAAAEFFAEEEPGVNVSVATSGTGGGFEVFCQGTTDVSNASRPISDEEIAICEENGVEYTELTVARDALTVVTSAENDFITCLTTEQLATLWGPRGRGDHHDVGPDRPVVPGRADRAVRPRHRLGHLRLLHRRDQR